MWNFKGGKKTGREDHLVIQFLHSTTNGHLSYFQAWCIQFLDQAEDRRQNVGILQMKHKKAIIGFADQRVHEGEKSLVGELSFVVVRSKET